MWQLSVAEPRVPFNWLLLVLFMSPIRRCIRGINRVRGLFLFIYVETVVAAFNRALNRD